MKKTNIPLLAGIYALSLFFLVRYLQVCLYPRFRYKPSVGWMIEQMAVVYLCLLILAAVLLVVGLSLRFKNNPFFLVFLWTFFPLFPFTLYVLPYATTYSWTDYNGKVGYSSLYIEHYYEYELAVGIMLLMLGIFLQIKRARSAQSNP